MRDSKSFENLIRSKIRYKVDNHIHNDIKYDITKHVRLKVHNPNLDKVWNEVWYNVLLQVREETHKR